GRFSIHFMNGIEDNPEQMTEVEYKKRMPALLSRFGNEPKAILRNFINIFKEFKILKKENPDIVIFRAQPYSFSLVLLLKMMKIPLILEVNSSAAHEFRFYDKGHFRMPFVIETLERINFKAADAITVVSENLKKYLIAIYKIHADKIIVNPNGADPEKFNEEVMAKDPELVRHHNLEGKLVLGYVGGFYSWHSLDGLIDVFKEIVGASEGGSNLVLLLVGDGPERSNIDEKVHALGLEEKIIFTGKINYEKLPHYMALMDVGVLPNSTTYCSPLKIFEYMIMGKAVVAPDYGPINAIITNRDNGMLFDHRDIYTIKSLLIELIENNDLRQTLSARARETILKGYTWEHNAQRVWEGCLKIKEKYS
ncbi:MAG: glycosyltransferase family 4 protein, partial [Candidatus Heimdallarchaeota archaeon]|nr:glycosyltransferase family 4 protein [Candidatus Heimdallarchaeota archaeon]